MRVGGLTRAIFLAALVTFVYVVALVTYPARYTAETGVPEDWIASPADLSGDRALLNEKQFSRRNSSLAELPRCPLYPKTLQGLSPIELMNTDFPSSEDILGRIKPLLPGGAWSPAGCRSIQSVAIIIPYRDRLPHLRQLLKFLHPHLQRQLRKYRIFVVEQAYNETFNKGLIMNVGFEEAMTYGPWDCVVFHDVDMIPENDHNLYLCGQQPRHLSPALDQMRYTLMYEELVGGALAITPRQFRRVNGYSNLYWGWGGEDDDMAARIAAAGYKILRPEPHIGRFKMVPHKKRKPADHRHELLLDWGRWEHEGLLTANDMKFHIVSRSNSTLYTNITIDVGPSPAR